MKTNLLLTTFLLTIVLACPCPSAAKETQSCNDNIIATSPKASFIFHDDGTVTQKTTGLVWMRCALGQDWDGKTCSGTPSAFSWAEALKASVLQDFAGSRDWRLPNVNELESIVEERCVSPALNAEAFPSTPGEFFWTSSPYAGQASGAWSVDFGYGTVTASDKTAKIYVRLVRDSE